MEHARRKSRIKHGGGLKRVSIADAEPAIEPTAEEILAVDEALTRFGSEDAAAAELVKLRYFVGLSIEEAAEALGVSRATANRHWAYAKAWLRCEIGRPDDSAPG